MKEYGTLFLQVSVLTVLITYNYSGVYIIIARAADSSSVVVCMHFFANRVKYEFIV